MRIVQRDELVSWMNNTKWRELIAATPRAQLGRFRALCIDEQEPCAWQPGTLWPEHLPWWSLIEWVELDPRIRPGPTAAVIDHTGTFVQLLRDARVPYTLEESGLLRAWGYTRPGRTPAFER
jgi:hypothetical protein